MLLFCCYTPAHEVLYRQVFRPSVPEGFEVRPTLIGIEGPGDYLSDEFLRCIRAKLDLVVRSIAENPGKVIVWSDVDIQFFDASPSELTAELESSEYDVLFQRESPRLNDVNTGFFVCRCIPAVLVFFRTVRSELDQHREENEQMVVNRLIFNNELETWNSKLGTLKPKSSTQNSQISWGYLPRSFYARTQGWPPPRHLMIYHANYTKGADGIGQKLAQFREVEDLIRGGWRIWLWSVMKRIPMKMVSMLQHDNRARMNPVGFRFIASRKNKAPSGRHS